MMRLRLYVNIVLASLLTFGSASVAAAQDAKPSAVEKMKTNMKHNREKVRACRREAIEKNIPGRDRATYEEACLKRAH
jgi:hypothetical protein